MVQIATPSRSSKLQIGDFVLKAGIYTNPGVVVEKKEDGTVIVDTEPDMIKQYHRHTNTTGLTPDEKQRFNEIMDNVIRADQNSDRINQLQSTIDTLKSDPTHKKVVEALRNEQAQLIRISRELPRVYAYDGNQIR